MRVGKAVNPLVHANPSPDRLWVRLDIDALEKISHQISHDRLGRVIRQVKVSQKVHASPRSILTEAGAAASIM